MIFDVSHNGFGWGDYCIPSCGGFIYERSLFTVPPQWPCQCRFISLITIFIPNSHLASCNNTIPRTSQCSCHGQCQNSLSRRHYNLFILTVSLYSSYHLLNCLNSLEGCRIEYLSLYSPDYSPIEPAFSVIKAHLHRQGLNFHHEKALYDACSCITLEATWGFFQRSGYRGEAMHAGIDPMLSKSWIMQGEQGSGDGMHGESLKLSMKSVKTPPPCDQAFCSQSELKY